MLIHRFVCHSRQVLDVAKRFGWRPAARYTNLRDVRHAAEIAFLDIDWRNYNFIRHLEVAAATRPFMTVARDILEASQLQIIVGEAERLAKFARYVIIVPKARGLAKRFATIPAEFLLGYSVPTRYGGTSLPIALFNRPVHLLGGRPDVQRRLADRIPVFSVDCNRFTLDAAFGDYFDGRIFRPHPTGGYVKCLAESLRNMNRLWRGYEPPRF